MIGAVLAERESKQAHNKTQSKKKAADQSLELEPALKLESKEFEKTVVQRRVNRRGCSEDESISSEDAEKATSGKINRCPRAKKNLQN